MENKYMENEINLEKKIKELDNIIYKVAQSAQTVHILTKPQVFYDNAHKQALGYQNPFYLKKGQRIKPTLYDGIVIYDKHVAMPVIDDEDTLILEEDSRSKMSQDSLVDKQCLEIAKKELLLENDQLLQQIMSQDVLLTVMNSMSVNGESVNVETQRSESCDKCLNFDVEFSKSKQAYNDLLKNYSQLEKHCISLELTIQLNQEIFQKDKSCDNQNALEIPKYFEINDLKAQFQDKDTTICKLKEIIKSLRGNNKEEIVNYDRCELETINEELENSVAKLLLENKRLCKEINHVKHVFKDQFDSIKKICVHTKEHSDSLIDKLDLKSAKYEDLKA
ncbi:hypothetical protein Tco_1576302 [Tanacetum coccineum]